MALSALAALGAVVLFTLIAASLGHYVLRIFSADIPCEEEHVLCSAALGVIALQVLLFFAEFTGRVRAAVVFSLALGTFLGAADFSMVLRKMRAIWRRICAAQRPEKLLAGAAALVLLLEFLAAMAPLTGSDALHYHFPAPLRVLQQGSHPDFFLAHSFLCGQGHLLILAGLALGSEQLAMGLLFLGGALSAAAVACLVRRWAGAAWAGLAALAFLLTPVVFWQMSTAGAPDLWMSFFAALGVLVISRSKEIGGRAAALLAGALAGGVAGTKYTGCFVAVSLAAAFVWEVRSAAKAFVFLSAALVAGIWPYMRNAIWTGDPVFPFFLQRFAPERVNTFTLAAMLADTGAAQARSFWQLAKFPLFAAIDPAHLGFWQFFGPLVVVFAPAILLAVRNTPTWRSALTVWIVSALGVGATSGMTRFLLPVFPIALAAAVAAIAGGNLMSRRPVRIAAGATLGLYLALGAAGLFLSSAPALLVAAGLTSREAYLARRAPEYEKEKFVDEFLAGRKEGKTLVFFRHLYYLKAPYVYADPASSWAINPDRLRTADDWRELFRREGIRWVVRAPGYPAAIAAPLAELESRGILAPAGSRTVSDLQGFRIRNERQPVNVVILRVND